MVARGAHQRHVGKPLKVAFRFLVLPRLCPLCEIAGEDDHVGREALRRGEERLCDPCVVVPSKVQIGPVNDRQRRNRSVKAPKAIGRETA